MAGAAMERARRMTSPFLLTILLQTLMRIVYNADINDDMQILAYTLLPF